MRSRDLMVIAVVVTASQIALATLVRWAQNGHWYEVVVVYDPKRVPRPDCAA